MNTFTGTYCHTHNLLAYRSRDLRALKLPKFSGSSSCKRKRCKVVMNLKSVMLTSPFLLRSSLVTYVSRGKFGGMLQKGHHHHHCHHTSGHSHNTSYHHTNYYGQYHSQYNIMITVHHHSHHLRSSQSQTAQFSSTCS